MARQGPAAIDDLPPRLYPPPPIGRFEHMAGKKSGAGGPFRFRVSDSLEVPLRGHLLRLKVNEGTPSMSDLGPGSRLRVVAPDGRERTVTVVGHGATGGRATQERLERMRELDVVISSNDAGAYEDRIGIGWMATGPVR